MLIRNYCFFQTETSCPSSLRLWKVCVTIVEGGTRRNVRNLAVRTWQIMANTDSPKERETWIVIDKYGTIFVRLPLVVIGEGSNFVSVYANSWSRPMVKIWIKSCSRTYCRFSKNLGQSGKHVCDMGQVKTKCSCGSTIIYSLYSNLLRSSIFCNF